jgi:ring-1,2-phenylacetyl-CoA epoxidase subunit PaaC
MEPTLEGTVRKALFVYLLRLGDDALILGHRLSEWCGHGPYLEEDIALANLALDYLGHAEALLTLAGEIEGAGRTADDLAFRRDVLEFYNVHLVELPRGDFAFTIARQFLFSVYAHLLFAALRTSRFQPLAGIAAKAHKELTYHVRHSRTWMHCLGEGTEESHYRLQRALNVLWEYTGELFEVDDTLRVLMASSIAPDMAALYPQWKIQVESVIQQATLSIPEASPYRATGGRRGHHTEHLGHLLAEMQFLPRAYPDAKW